MVMFLAMVMCAIQLYLKGQFSGHCFFYFVYINDLIVNLGCDVHLFADDTSLLDCLNDHAE